jgi:putative PEP-CTERM system TPR-repeat lipoprotein
MMTKNALRWTQGFAATAVLALVAACGGGDPEKLVASAKTYLAKGEARSAIIELKTALQRQPDLAEARFLLGSALLANEEPVGAVVELRKALELKHPQDIVLPELARAMLEMGQNKELVAQFASAALNDKQGLASMKTTIALAHARLGDPAAAMAAFELALDASPGYVPALVGMARQTAANGDRDGALKATGEIIASGKADADAWVLQGDLLAFARNDKGGAIAAYRKAIELTPNHLPAHAGIIQLEVGTGGVKAAAEQVAALQKVRPGHPTTRYFQAQVAFLQGDYKAAKELILQLLKGAPQHAQINQLAGAIELASGSNEAARAYLGKALQAAPRSVIARRLLASAHLRSGEPGKALELLQPLLAQASPDGVALALAGEAQMQLGNLDKAAAMFAQAAKANPGNVNNLTALARTRFLKGDATGAVADLEQIAASDAGTVADLELINTQLRRRDFQGALKAIDGLERKQAGKPLPSMLRGAAFLGLKDTPQARASFEKALAIDASFFPAALNLAALDVADKKPQIAQQRFEAILKAQPGHMRALLALADLRARNGASKQEVTDLLETAVRLNPTEATARLSLINRHLANKEAEAALAAAQQADAALPNQPAILDALGRAQQAAGQQNQALATFNKIIALQPGEPLAHMRIAAIQVGSKDNDAAIESLKRAVAAKPDAIVPLQRLFALEVQAGRHADALKLARDVQKRQPAHSLGYVFEGDVQRAQKNDAAALASYKVALGKNAGDLAAPRVHSLLISIGKKAEADQFASSWAKDHPKDVQFTIYLGDNALARKDYPAAEAAYRHVVELQPNHVPSLNNIAWLMVKSNKPGALPFAEKANELQPNQPALMDTLAVALAAENKLDQAIELQKRAVSLAPESNSLRLSLARMHVQAGQKPQARELLESLSKLGDKLPEQAEVKSLLAAL